MSTDTIDRRNSNTTEHPVHHLIEHRWSPKAFAEGVNLEEDTIRSLFEAARWAPSSYNEQPWRYVYATADDPEAFGQLLGCLNDKNRMWARRASMLIVSVASLKLQRNGKPNRHAFYDTGQANFALVLQALSMNLYVHQMGGFDRGKTAGLLGLDDDHEPVVFMAVGYLDDPDILPEHLRKGDLSRRPRNLQEHFVSRFHSARL